jgi:hypothetical protein
MSWQLWPWDDWDEAAYDTEHDPPPGQLEADQIRRDCLEAAR